MGSYDLRHDRRNSVAWPMVFLQRDVTKFLVGKPDRPRPEKVEEAWYEWESYVVHSYSGYCRAIVIREFV